MTIDARAELPERSPEPPPWRRRRSPRASRGGLRGARCRSTTGSGHVDGRRFQGQVSRLCEPTERSNLSVARSKANGRIVADATRRRAGRALAGGGVIATATRRPPRGRWAEIAPQKSKTFWSEIRQMAQRGLAGQDRRLGRPRRPKAAAAKEVGGSWQRCRVSFHAQRRWRTPRERFAAGVVSLSQGNRHRLDRPWPRSGGPVGMLTMSPINCAPEPRSVRLSRRSNPISSPHGFPKEHWTQDLLDQSDRAAQWRIPVAGPRGRQLPQRRRHHPSVGAIPMEQSDEWAVHEPATDARIRVRSAMIPSSACPQRTRTRGPILLQQALPTANAQAHDHARGLDRDGQGRASDFAVRLCASRMSQVHGPSLREDRHLQATLRKSPARPSRELSRWRPSQRPGGRPSRHLLLRHRGGSRE